MKPATDAEIAELNERCSERVRVWGQIGWTPVTEVVLTVEQARSLIARIEADAKVIEAAKMVAKSAMRDLPQATVAQGEERYAISGGQLAKLCAALAERGSDAPV